MIFFDNGQILGLSKNGNFVSFGDVFYTIQDLKEKGESCNQYWDNISQKDDDSDFIQFQYDPFDGSKINWKQMDKYIQTLL